MLKDTDLHFPLTTAGIKKFIGELGKAYSYQAAAATAGPTTMDNGFAKHAGKLRSVKALLDATPGAGESLTVDVLVDGVSVIVGGAGYTLDSSNAVGGAWLELPIDPTKEAVSMASIVTVNRTYVAGAGAVSSNEVEAHWS